MTPETSLLPDKDLKELLIKNWMTHDGLWFYHCLQEFGIEKANALNLAAIKSLAAIEVPRIAKALGLRKEEIKSFEDFKRFFPRLFSAVKGDFMEFDYRFTDQESLVWEMHRCFAHEGMKRMGVIGQYRCGVLHRIMCWLEVLELSCSIIPPVDLCLLQKTGRCSGEIRFFLAEPFTPP
jgi:hypothetical protein